MAYVRAEISTEIASYNRRSARSLPRRLGMSIGRVQAPTSHLPVPLFCSLIEHRKNGSPSERAMTRRNSAASYIYILLPAPLGHIGATPTKCAPREAVLWYTCCSEVLLPGTKGGSRQANQPNKRTRRHFAAPRESAAYRGVNHLY